VDVIGSNEERPYLLTPSREDRRYCNKRLRDCSSSMLSLLILLRWLQYHVVFVQMWATVRSFYILSDCTVFEPCASWEATPTLGSPLSWTLSPMPMWMSSRARGSVNFYNVWNNVWLMVMVVTNPSRNFKKEVWVGLTWEGITYSAFLASLHFRARKTFSLLATHSQNASP